MDESEREVKPKRRHFVLVHGVCCGAWCWYKLRSLMETSGNKVSCIDLKSAGIDRSDPDSILTFDDYNSPLIDFLTSLRNTEKVILVGHSAGGLSVTDATNRFPQKVALTVYVTAAMLKYGISTQEDVKDGVPALSEYGDVTGPASFSIKKEFQRQLLFSMTPLQDWLLADMLLKAAPMKAVMGARFDEGSDVVPRVYIKATRDCFLNVEQQETMIRRWPPSLVYALESDHFPQFSTPFLLFGVIINAAEALNK